MGMFRAEAGPQQSGIRKLIDLLRHGEGRAWVKFTGTYRISVQLFNLLADWAPDEAMRRRILVNNPAALFGF